MAGDERRLVFQGVLRLYGFDWDEPWGEGEARQSVLVFIGMPITGNVEQPAITPARCAARSS